MIPRRLPLIALLSLAPLTALRAQTVTVNHVRSTGEQYRQQQQEADWRATQDQMRRETIAAEQVQIRREAVKKASDTAALDSSMRQFVAEKQAAYAREQAYYAARERETQARLAAEAAAHAAAIRERARQNDITEVERAARRHVREAALAENRAGKISKKEAARRMSCATPARESVIEDFTAGRINKATALSLLDADDKGVPIPTSGAPATVLPTVP